MTKKQIKAGNYTAKHFNHVLDDDKTAITAVYCPFGYVVWLDTNLLYACGNHALESTTVVDEKHPHAEDVKAIKEMAVSMAEEIANYPELHDLELGGSTSACVMAMGKEPKVFDLALFLSVNGKGKYGGATHRELIESAIRILGEASGAWILQPPLA